MEQWLEVTIRTASGGIDLLCAELTEAGFDSFVIDDSEQFRQFLDGARAYWDYVDEKLAARMRDLSQVRLYLPEETAEAQLAELRALLAELPGRYPACEFGPLTLALDRIPGEDWANSWKQNYRPLPVGERLLVVPQWMTVDDLQGRLPVILDLGLTFGTGEHASTQLCMRALESLLHGGERVADLGSGSGILSVSALRLGAASAVGVDIDPSAEHIAAANAAQNGFGPDRFTARTGDVVEDADFLQALAGDGFDIVCANIVADVIIRLAPVVPKLMRPDAAFVCSGILTSREDDVRAALEQQGACAVLLQLKSTFGNFYYSSSIDGAELTQDAAQELTTFFSGSNLMISFETDDTAFPADVCTGRLYIRDVDGSKIEKFAQAYGGAENLTELVFLVNSKDTRFDERAVLRPLLNS